MTEAYVVTGLGFGDEGKGRTVDHLVRQIPAGEEVTTVFYNGGCQRAHSVVDALGQHTFSQFGSGTFAGARTHHSRFSMIHPQQLLREASHLKELGVAGPLDLVTFDYDCPVVTPFHQAANRLREIARGGGAHGTTGQGIGETTADMLRGLVLRAGDLYGGSGLRRVLMEVQARKRAEMIELGFDGKPTQDGTRRQAEEILWNMNVVDKTFSAYRQFAGWAQMTTHTRPEGVLVLEGSQGVLLDQDVGFAPHTTWSKTTTENARTLLGEWGVAREDTTYVGVTRAYATRHGAGPFPTENELLLEWLRDAENGDEGWAGAWRVGYPDLMLFRYALKHAGELDGLAVTCMDRLAPFDERSWQVCSGYRIYAEGGTPGSAAFSSLDAFRGERLTEFLNSIEPIYEPMDPRDMPWLLSEVSGLPVVLESWGAGARAGVGSVG